MTRKSRGKAPKGSSSTRPSKENKMDKFYEQRSKIKIESDEESDDVDQSEEEQEEVAVMDLDLNDSESDDFNTSEDDVESIDRAQEKNNSKAWGKNKKDYYSGEILDDKQELTEALKLQKQTSLKLKDEDYFDDIEVNKTLTLNPHQHPKKSNKGSLSVIKQLVSGPVNTKDLNSNTVACFTLEEKKKLVEDYEEFLKELLSDYEARVTEIKNHIGPILSKYKSESIATNKGLGFLQIKHQLLTSYCSNICFFQLLKLNGKKIEGHPVIEELVKQRVILEKMRPIEQKLKFQIDRLLQNAQSETADEKDDNPLNFKPVLSNLSVPESKGNSEAEEGQNEEIYKPSRIAPAYFEDQNAASKQKKGELVKKVSGARSRLLKEMKNEYSEKPEELGNDFGFEESEVDDQTAFEEEHFTRLTLSKKEAKKKSVRKMKMMDELDDLNDFAILQSDSEAENSKFDLKSHKLSKNKRHHKEESDEEILSSDDDDSNHKFKKKYQKDSEQEEEEDDLPVKSSRKPMKHAKEDFSKSIDPYHNRKPGAKRPVNYRILKNKGLTPHRTKEQRNPRVRQRQRYEKANKRVRGFKPIVKPLERSYIGEKSGIKKNISKSIRLS